MMFGVRADRDAKRLRRLFGRTISSSSRDDPDIETMWGFRDYVMKSGDGLEDSYSPHMTQGVSITLHLGEVVEAYRTAYKNCPDKVVDDWEASNELAKTRLERDSLETKIAHHESNLHPLSGQQLHNAKGDLLIKQNEFKELETKTTNELAVALACNKLRGLLWDEYVALSSLIVSWQCKANKNKCTYDTTPLKLSGKDLRTAKDVSGIKDKIVGFFDCLKQNCPNKIKLQEHWPQIAGTTDRDIEIAKLNKPVEDQITGEKNTTIANTVD